MQVKVLGTQSPYATEGHNCPGFLITEGDAKVMLDCGSGSHRLLNYPEDLRNLHVFISHLHCDHYNDVYNLQYASYVFHKQKRLEKPISIYLPMMPTNIHEDIVLEDNAFADYATILNDYMGVKIGKLKVSFCLNGHSNESYSIKVEDGIHTVVYTSDISFVLNTRKKIIRFAKNADLLICESSLLERHGFSEINPHLTAKQAAIIAKEANVKKLMLTHFWPEESPESYVEEAKAIFDNVVATSEGDIFSLEDESMNSEKKWNPALWEPFEIDSTKITTTSFVTKHNGFVEHQPLEEHFEVPGLLPKVTDVKKNYNSY